MSTFAEEFNKDKCVVIPPIQREYVQPLNKSVINGFVDALIKAYSSGVKKDLNYIYGVDNGMQFEPIDGQQRLTTLWLLHLYVAALCGEELPIKFEYRTREFATDFCKKLKENAVKILRSTDCPSKDIKDASWYIESWNKNITASSMLYALDVIHQQISSSNVDVKQLWASMIKEDSPVTFAFRSTEDLGDDIYVKMNARGKSLSDFENLKSWLDDRLVELIKDGDNSLDNDFLKDWRERMDNDWTDLFWRNRNLNDLYPEEIDDEQMRLFFNIAYIIWAQKNKFDRQSLIRNKADKKLISSLLCVKEDEIVDECLKKMRRSSVDMPLYLLDKLNVFDADFFLTAKKTLNGLLRYEDEINKTLQVFDGEESFEKIYFWDIPKDIEVPISFLCQLLMSERDSDVSYTKLSIGAALCYYVQNEFNTISLRDWMRFVRNIANNSRVEAETIHNVLSAFKTWANECSYKSIQELITDIPEDTSGIDTKQIEEEKIKSGFIQNFQVLKAIHHLENHRFFFGRIRFLFEFLQQTSQVNCDSALINYSEILYKLFNSDGPIYDSKEDGYLAHRTLLACSEYHGIGYEYKRSWCLLESKEEWKEKYLEGVGSDIDTTGIPHNIGLVRLLMEIGNPENLTKTKLKEILSQYRKNVKDWRLPLLEHTELWNYMRSYCLKFQGNYNVLLIPGVVLQSSGRRAELRSRSLYLDLKYGDYLKSIYPSTNDGEYKPNEWLLRFWDYGSDRKDKNSCLYFEKEFNGEKLVIDIYFDVEYASDNETEDSYCVELFVRENKRQNPELIIANEKIWGALAQSLHFSRDNRDDSQGRYYLKHLPKHVVISLLCNHILKFTPQ